MAGKKRSPLLQQYFQTNGLMPLEGKLEKRTFQTFSAFAFTVDFVLNINATCVDDLFILYLSHNTYGHFQILQTSLKAMNANIYIHAYNSLLQSWYAINHCTLCDQKIIQKMVFLNCFHCLPYLYLTLLNKYANFTNLS